MKDSILLNSDGLNGEISKLKSKLDEVNKLLDNVKKTNKNLPSYISTKSGDTIIQKLNAEENKFESFTNRGEEFIKFLNNVVISDYSNKDKSLDDILDDLFSN